MATQPHTGLRIAGVVALIGTAAHADLLAGYSFDETDSGVPAPIVDSVGPIFSNGGVAGGVNLNVSGIAGSGIAFDGVDDVAGLGGSSSEFKQTGDFTVTLWVQLSSSPTDTLDRLIDATNSNGAIGGAQGWRLMLNPAGPDNGSQLAFQANGTNQAGSVNVAFNGIRDLQNDGGWSFVALRYDTDGGVSVSVLYDSDLTATGSLIATNTQAFTSDGALTYGGQAAPRLGANQSGTGNYFSGQMDELMLWDSLLTDAELAAQFNAVVPTPASVSVLAAGLLIGSRRRRGTAV